MHQIKLSGLGGRFIALIDDADYDLVSPHKWRVLRTRTVLYAAYRIYVTDSEGRTKRRWVKMHRLLMGFPAYHVDHKNHNGLDNQRHNLRPATVAQNRTNSRLKPSKAGYRGVTAKPGKTFAAKITADGVSRYLGSFPKPELAALAYDKAAQELHGEFATLNFPQ